MSTVDDSAPASPRPRWQRACDAIASPAPDPIVEGMAWAGSITVLVGESSAGKTFLLLDLAAAVSADADWHGRHVRQGSFVYFGFEGHVGLRLRALHQVAGQGLDHVYVVRATEPLSPSIDRDRLELPSRGELDAARDLHEIAASIEATGRPPIAIVAIDTVRASLSGSEDSSDAVSAYLRAVRRLITHAPGAAFILAHHAGWQDGETRRRRERGSSAFRGNVDGTVYLEADGYDPVRGQTRLTLTTIKVRDGEPHPPLYLVRRRVEIPGIVDIWGNPVTSCLIESDARNREEREAERAHATETETRALDLQTLGVIADRPDLTSQNAIRLTLSVGRQAVYPAIRRLIAYGWLEPPPAQRKPYTVTPAGRTALAEARVPDSS